MMRDASLVLLNVFYLGVGQLLYFTQMEGDGMSAFYKLNVTSSVPASITGALGLQGVAEDVVVNVSRAIEPMGITTVGNFDRAHAVVFGGKGWLWVGNDTESTWKEFSLSGFSVRSVVITSGHRHTANVESIYAALLAHDTTDISGIYRIVFSKNFFGEEIVTPELTEISPCPGDMATSGDRQSIFWTDMCDGKIYSIYLDGGVKQVVLDGLIHPKGLAFNGDYTKMFYVAEYSIWTATVDAFEPNINGTTAVYRKAILTKLKDGLVAPLELQSIPVVPLRRFIGQMRAVARYVDRI
jgi:hypothetical protein